MHELTNLSANDTLIFTHSSRKRECMHNVPYVHGGLIQQCKTQSLLAISVKQDGCSAFPSADFSVIVPQAPADTCKWQLCVSDGVHWSFAIGRVSAAAPAAARIPWERWTITNTDALSLRPQGSTKRFPYYAPTEPTSVCACMYSMCNRWQLTAASLSVNMCMYVFYTVGQSLLHVKHVLGVRELRPGCRLHFPRFHSLSLSSYFSPLSTLGGQTVWLAQCSLHQRRQPTQLKGPCDKATWDGMFVPHSGTDRTSWHH